MWAAIGAAVEVIAQAWTAIKAFLRLNRVVSLLRRMRSALSKYKSLECALQWYFYIRQIEFLFKWLVGFGVNPSTAAAWLGLTRIIDVTSTDTERSILRQLTHNREALEESIEVAEEIEKRRNMAESELNGVHKPPYKSTTILEVHYHYDKMLGTGSMIIIFNPEGFNWKMRAPQIVNFVSEDELKAFLAGIPSNSRNNSMGNFWRRNYLLRTAGKGSMRHRTGRYKNKDFVVEDFGNPKLSSYSLEGSWKNQAIDERDLVKKVDPRTLNKSQPVEPYNVLSMEYREKAKVMDLDTYMESLNFTDDNLVMSGSRYDFIQQAAERHLNIAETFSQELEKGTLGNALDRSGLRVTSATSDVVSRIPQNLEKIISGNPLFSDIAKLTSSYKKVVGRWRYLRDVWSSKKIARTWDAEVLALSGALGRAKAQAYIAASVGLELKDVFSSTLTEAINAAETGAVSLEEALQNIDVATRIGELERARYEHSQHLDRINDMQSDAANNEWWEELEDLNVDYSKVYEKYKEVDSELENLNVPPEYKEYINNVMQEQVEAGVSIDQIFQQNREKIGKETVKNLFSNPGCIPFM